MKSFIPLLEETIVEKSNLEHVLEKLSNSIPRNYKYIIHPIKNFVKKFIYKNGYNVKFLNACTGFAGVRTKDTIIICSPNTMGGFGDFLYTIFHEIRHEQQVSKIKMENPLTDMDLEDFENLYRQYWEMELDADQYAKNMLIQLIQTLDLTKEEARTIFRLSPHIDQYPQFSDMVRKQLRTIIDYVKKMKSSGQKYEDIQDHPMVKMHLDKLERFI